MFALCPEDQRSCGSLRHGTLSKPTANQTGPGRRSG